MARIFMCRSAYRAGFLFTRFVYFFSDDLDYKPNVDLSITHIVNDFSPE